MNKIFQSIASLWANERHLVGWSSWTNQMANFLPPPLFFCVIWSPMLITETLYTPHEWKKKWFLFPWTALPNNALVSGYFIFTPYPFLGRNLRNPSLTERIGTHDSTLFLVEMPISCCPSLEPFSSFSNYEYILTNAEFIIWGVPFEHLYHRVVHWHNFSSVCWFRAGLYNDALVSAYMALEVSPTFVVVHFTTANIHAARVSSTWHCIVALIFLFHLKNLVETNVSIGCFFSKHL